MGLWEKWENDDMQQINVETCMWPALLFLVTFVL